MNFLIFFIFDFGSLDCSEIAQIFFFSGVGRFDQNEQSPECMHSLLRLLKLCFNLNWWQFAQKMAPLSSSRFLTSNPILVIECKIFPQITEFLISFKRLFHMLSNFKSGFITLTGKMRKKSTNAIAYVTRTTTITVLWERALSSTKTKAGSTASVNSLTRWSPTQW